MKKLLSVLTLAFTLVLSLGFLDVKAEGEELIDVYPYENIDCSLALPTCPGAKVGRNNWTVEFAGHRIWIIRDNTRYGHEITDKDNSGFIEPGEFQGINYNAFGTLWINNTNETMKLKGNATRSDLTAVTHRIWTYFDEEGVLQMIEDQIFTTHMVDDNHGQEGKEADWRFATALEARTFDEAPADAKPENMRNAHYRAKRVDKSVDADGYVLEPLTYIQWYHADYNKDVEGSKMTTILDYDPRQAHIPAGWKVYTFGTLERDGRYPIMFNLVKSLPAIFQQETPAKMRAVYVNTPATFKGFAGLDDNPYVPGVQVVAEFDKPLEIDFSELSASYTKMYNDEGKIINEKNVPVDKFEIEIKDGETVVKTVKFTYNTTTEKYDADDTDLSAVKTDEFEKIYSIAMKSATPVEGSVSGEVVVGVLPNRFEGVANKVIRDGEYIDLLAGVKAFDGNGGDITKDIKVSWSDGFNPYNPQPGKYTVTLDVAKNYHWDPVLTWPKEGEKTSIYFELRNADGSLVSEHAVLYPQKYNVPFHKDNSPVLTYIDQNELIKSVGVGWGSIALVIKEGVVIHQWNFVSGKYTGLDGEATKELGGKTLEEHLKAFELGAGEYMLIGHGTPHVRPHFETAWGKKMVKIGRADVDYKAEAQATFQVTVDDRTAPQVRVVNTNYQIDGTMFEDAEEAILANVVAFDNYSDVDIIVDDDGGLDLAVPATYTVVVDVEDKAFNKTSVTFDVTVLPPKLTEAEVAELLEEQAADFQEIIDAQEALIAAQQQALIAAQQQALADLGAQVEADNATKEELAAAKAEAAAAAAAAQQAAQNAANAAAAAQNTANDNATQITAVDDAKLGTGANIGLMILFALVGAGLSFGASFLVFGRKK